MTTNRTRRCASNSTRRNTSTSLRGESSGTAAEECTADTIFALELPGPRIRRMEELLFEKRDLTLKFLATPRVLILNAIVPCAGSRLLASWTCGKDVINFVASQWTEYNGPWQCATGYWKNLIAGDHLAAGNSHRIALGYSTHIAGPSFGWSSCYCSTPALT